MNKVGTIGWMLVAGMLVGGTGLAWGQATDSDGTNTAADVETPLPGALVGAAEDGLPFCLPLLRTDVRLQVAAHVAYAQVTQVFTNDTDRRLEAVYVFPLPARATVCDMTLHCGARIIRSVVREREQAQAEYAAARADGRRAALMEQERPNLFTTSVANLAPGESVQIALTYMEPLDYQDGAYRLAFPMVVAPRYIPLPPPRASGDTNAPADPVPDAPRINPPRLHPAVDDCHRVTFHAYVRGLPVRAITSATHTIEVTEMPTTSPLYEVTLREPPAIPDCDLALEIAVAAGALPALAAVHGDTPDARHVQLSLFPPQAAAAPVAPPRDILFLVDTSGSMEGDALAQAKTGLLSCLDGLKPDDHFAIVRFASDYSAFSQHPQAALPATVAQARAYVAGLGSDGGTEMQPALEHVLEQPGRSGAMRLVIFLTDGDVGNEDSLFRLLDRKLGRARLFTIGIGSAPNAYFMRRMAEVGGGECRFIRAEEQIGTAIAGLFATLDHPMLTDIEVEWFDTTGQAVPNIRQYPERCPDLFGRRPVILQARLPAGFTGSARVRGMVSNQRIEYTCAVGDPDLLPLPGLERLFGQAELDRLTLDLLRADTPPDQERLRAAVVETALRYQLLCAYTARVAVEEQIEQRPDGELATVQVPVRLPKGWNAAGDLTATATRDPLLALAAGLLGLLAWALGRTARRPAP